MENATSLAALLGHFRTDGVDGIEVAIRRIDDEKVEIVAACSTKTDTHESRIECFTTEDLGRALADLLAAAVTKATGVTPILSRVRQPAAVEYASAPRPPTPSLDVTKKLSDREREVLCLVAAGDSNKNIAVKLGISVHTVNAHRVSIMHKLDIHDARGLTRFAMQHGLIEHRR